MVSLSPMRPQAYAPIVIPQHRPFYRILAGNFFGPDDTLYPEGSVIGWDGEPNLEMEPLNDKAQEMMKTFLTKLDKFGREAAEKAGKHYNSLADAHENAYALAQRESKQVERIDGPKQVPLMGAKKKQGAVETVETKTAPLMGQPVGKLSLGAKNEMVNVDK